MITSILACFLASVAFLVPASYVPASAVTSPSTLLSVSDFDDLGYYPALTLVDGRLSPVYGVLDSSSLVYSSPGEFPDPIPDDFTAYVPVTYSGQLDGALNPFAFYYASVELGPVSGSRPTLDDYTLVRHQVTSFDSVVFLRCYYYHGEPISVGSPVLATVHQSYVASFTSVSEVSYYSALYTSSTFSDSEVYPSDGYYYFLALQGAQDLDIPLPPIGGDTLLATLYNFGVWVNDTVSDFAQVLLSFTVFGYPLYQLLLGAGFIVFAGWVLVKFFIPT